MFFPQLLINALIIGLLDYASNITLAPQVMTYHFLYFISLNTKPYDFKRFGQAIINLL